MDGGLPRRARTRTAKRIDTVVVSHVDPFPRGPGSRRVPLPSLLPSVSCCHSIEGTKKACPSVSSIPPSQCHTFLESSPTVFSVCGFLPSLQQAEKKLIAFPPTGSSSCFKKSKQTTTVPTVTANRPVELPVVS